MNLFRRVGIFRIDRDRSVDSGCFLRTGILNECAARGPNEVTGVPVHTGVWHGQR